MTDPIVPVKNPNRVPDASQVDDPVGTAGTIPDTPSQETLIMASDFKFNPQTGAFEATADGLYERDAKEPADRVRTQLRKGYAVSEADAKVMKRIGPWPGETDEATQEAQATASAKQAAAPENKAASTPSNR